MSFPSATQLADCRAVENLVGYIQSGEWHSYFPPHYLKRGEDYARRGLVSTVELDPRFNDNGTIAATVVGSRPQPYKVFLEFYARAGRKSPSPAVSLECSCPIGYACKHTAAVLTILRGIIEDGPEIPERNHTLPGDLQPWLDSLQAATTSEDPPKKKPSPSFLAYCIEMGWENQPVLRLRRGSHGRSGPKISDGNAKANPSKPAGYISTDDYPLIMLFHHHCKDHWDPELPLEGAAAAEILKGALARETLFFDLTSEADRYGKSKTEYHQLITRPTLKASPSWTSEADGSAQPSLDLRSPDGRSTTQELVIFATVPPLYLDPGSRQLGEITSETSPKVLAAWLAGPRIPVDQLESASAALVTLDIAAPAPVKTNLKRLRRTKPKPHLHIRPAGSGEHSHLIVGDLRFRYGDSELLSPIGENESRIATWTRDDVRYVLERNQKAEAMLGYQLHDLGFSTLNVLFPWEELPPALEKCFVPDTNFAPIA